MGTFILHGANALPGAYEAPRGFRIGLGMDELGEVDRPSTALAEKGRVAIQLQDTFWARRYGKVVDRFGIIWEISGGVSPAPNLLSRSVGQNPDQAT